MYLKGQVYRGRKPIHWCKQCHTALAEAEIEYSDEVSPSVYVKFKLDAMPGIFEAAGATGDAYVLIWTTTPWTLPANAAVCLMPDADYVMVQVDGSNVIFAKELVGERRRNRRLGGLLPGVRRRTASPSCSRARSCAALPILAPSARTLKARSSTATM